MNNNPLRIMLFAATACCFLLTGGHKPDMIAARRAKIAQMTPEEKERLGRLWERFQPLSPDEKEKLRRLEREIAADAHADELRDVMRRYYQWCTSLPTYERLELMELPAKQRIARIDEIKRKIQDAEGLKKWLDEKANKIIAEIIAEMPPKQQKYLAALGPSAKHFLLFRHLTARARGPDDNIRKHLSEQDLVDLRSRLSEQTRRLLESKKPSEQWQWLGQHLRLYFRTEMAARRSNRMRGAGRFQNTPAFGVADEELAELFENLPPKEQDRLLSLPAEEMQEELRRFYLEPRFPRIDRPGERKHRPDQSDRPRHRKNDSPR